MSAGRALSDVQIAGCFNRTLGRRYGARVIGGAEEPLYEPGSAGRPGIIRYTRDYPASALHELAHWCIAGPRRRRLRDYGYWYQPPPRADAAQAAFFRVELPVQALEARLADAAGVLFRVSVDDLDRADRTDQSEVTTAFAGEVRALADRMAAEPVSPRAAELEAQLRQYRQVVLGVGSGKGKGKGAERRLDRRAA